MNIPVPLKINQLAIDMGSRKLFAGVNLDLQSGEFVSIMGENGVGKTTLLEAILGFRKPSSGEVLFWGQRLNQTNPTSLYSKLAFVTSYPERYPWGATVKDLLATLESAHSTWNQALAQKLIDGFKLKDSQPLSEMSLGETTKVRLVKALAFEPELLILDELTANLSTDSKKAVLDVLIDLFSQKKMSVLYVCHSMEEAVSLSDRVLVLTDQGLLTRSL